MISGPGEETQVLPGVTKLGEQLQDAADYAVYEAELDGSAEPAVAEIRLGGSDQAARQLSRWQESLPLAHPNLLRLYAAGEAVMEERPIIYLISERADESLAPVLSERTLSERETVEFLEPLLSALNYLHRNGFAHMGIEPANVRASQETLKLSSGTLQRTEEGGDPTRDMHAVGVLVVQALTGKQPEGERNVGLYNIGEESGPLSAIIRHCLEPDPEKRWTAEQALNSLSAKAKSPITPAPNPEPVSARTELPVRQIAEGRHSVPSNRKWVLGGAAVILLIAAVAGLTRKRDVATPAPTPAAQGVAKPSPVAPDRAAVNKVPPSSSATELTRPVTKPGNLRSHGWAVVVASYGGRGLAEKRAHEIAKRWPKFHAEVFQPSSQPTRHLVVIGKSLSEDKADALRKRARGAGLPRDTYIKRFD